MKKIFTLLAAMLFVLTTNLSAQDAILTTPTQVNLTNNGGPLKQDVIIKTGLLSGLGALTSFTVTLQGANANQFSVEVPSLTIGDIIGELLGDGLKVTVTYKPTSTGTHNASLLINASLLGILLPSQKTVPVTGVCITPPGVTATNPSNGASDVRPNSPIIITFNQNVSVVDASKFTINGISHTGSVANYTENTIYMFGPHLPYGQTCNVVIGAGAVKGSNNNLTVADYSFSFSTNNGPRLLSITPDPAVTLDIAKYLRNPIIIELTFDGMVVPTNVANSIVSSNPDYKITRVYSIVDDIGFPTNKIRIEVQYQRPLTPSHVFTLTLNNYAVSEYTDGPGGLYYQGGSWTYTVELLSRRSATGNEDVVTDKTIASEVYYTISGMQIDATSLQRGQIYVKKITYEDGSVEAEKFVQKK